MSVLIEGIFTEEKTPGKLGKVVGRKGDIVYYDVYSVSPLLRVWRVERHDATDAETLNRYFQMGALRWVK